MDLTACGWMPCTRYSASRLCTFWRNWRLPSRPLGKRLGRAFVLIAESDLNDPRLVHSLSRGGYGLDAHWCDDFHHALHRYFTGEQDGYYADFQGLKDVATALRDGYAYQGQYLQCIAAWPRPGTGGSRGASTGGERPKSRSDRQSRPGRTTQHAVGHAAAEGDRRSDVAVALRPIVVSGRGVGSGDAILVLHRSSGP